MHAVNVPLKRKFKNFNQHTLSIVLEKIETQAENVVDGFPVISNDSSLPSSEELLMAQAKIAVSPRHIFCMTFEFRKKSILLTFWC